MWCFTSATLGLTVQLIFVINAASQQDINRDVKGLISNSTFALQKEKLHSENGTAEVKKVLQLKEHPQSRKEDELSEGSSPKIPRHLAPRQFSLKEKFLAGIKRPWFSSKIPENRQMLIVKKVQGLVPHEASAQPPTDMILGRMSSGLTNNLYGNHGVLPPTSGTPNSLDHLYLPEMVTKEYEYGKALDLNGIRYPLNNEIGSTPEDFNYGYEKQTNFRGNPIDINYHGHGGLPDMGGPINHNPVIPDTYQYDHLSGDKQPIRSHPDYHSVDDGSPPPRQHSYPTKSPKLRPNYPRHENNKHEEDGENNKDSPHGNDDEPPGRHLVAGDAGFHNIIALANLINSGQFEQLTNFQSTPGLSFKPASPPSGNQEENSHYNGHPHHSSNDEFQIENDSNRFDKDGNFNSVDRPSGGRQFGFDSPRNSEEGERNEFNNEFSDEEPDSARAPPHGYGPGRGGFEQFGSGRPDYDKEGSHHKQDFENDHERPYKNNRFNSPQRSSSSSRPLGWKENNNKSKKPDEDKPNMDSHRDYGQNMKYLHGDSPPHSDDGQYNDHDSNVDYKEGGGRHHSPGEEPDYDNNEDDNEGYDNRNHIKNQHLRPNHQGLTSEDDDDDNNSQEQFNSPSKTQTKPNANKTPYRTPNGFDDM